MSTQEPTRTITPETRRELLAAWDDLTARQNESGVRYYGALYCFCLVFANWFRFVPNSPYQTGYGGQE